MKRVVIERENGTRRVQCVPEGESAVEQSHKDDCDINSMIAKARRGQFIPPASRGVYGDFTACDDFQTAMNQIKAAEATFGYLPSWLRKRFDNDPAKAVEFVNDPENAEECYELGLLERPKAVQAEPGAPAEPVAPAVADPPPAAAPEAPTA